MPELVGNESRRGPFNWLKWLDTKARKLPRAESWLMPYDYFLLARYPRLQPKAQPENKAREVHLRAGRKAFRHTLAGVLRRISKHPDARRTLKGLDQKRRRQLAALVADTMADIEQYLRHRELRQRLREVAAEAPRRQHQQQLRLEKARRALESLCRYVKRLDRLYDRELLYQAQKALWQLPGGLPRPTDFASLAKDSRLYPVPENPVTFSEVELYWLFRQGCRLTGDESEVRTALIRNAFWVPMSESLKKEQLGVRPLTSLRLKYTGAQTKGCEAIRMAVGRFRLP